MESSLREKILKRKVCKFLKNSPNSLHEIIWDAFLTSEYQDEQWSDIDTCNLIIKKLEGEVPIEHT